MAHILAFETSCDETSVAVLKDDQILSNVVYTQTIHEKYGGVVPEIASRAHIKKIVPVYQEALATSHISLDDITAIAYTQSPGLIGSLLVGATFAKTLAQSRGLPLIEIDHIEAHAIANGIENPELSFPFLCLIVSGGHTEIRICHSFTHTEVIGHTIDDAAGEAFDKIAKLLNLNYPGGPLMDRYATEGNPNAYSFPMSQVSELDFSFSGIKTSALYFLQKNIKDNPNFITENIHDIAASVQRTIIDMLLSTLKKAINKTGIRQVCIAGGVSANSELRRRFIELARSMSFDYHIPDFQYCTDNAGMIGYAAYHKWKSGQYSHDYSLAPSAR